MSAADCHQSATIALEKLGEARFVLDEFYRYVEEARRASDTDMAIATEEYAAASQALHVACSEMENIVNLTGNEVAPARQEDAQ